GQLLITLPDEAAGVGYQHTSAQAFDLRESSFAIEVVQPHMGADGQGWIEINRHEALTNAQRYLGFNFSGDQLHCAYDVGAGSVRLASVPLSTVDHRFVRIRESEGTVFWETARDGRRWNVLCSAPA